MVLRSWLQPTSGLAQRVLGIPFKRAQQRVIDYLEYEEIDSILKAIDRTTRQGNRDYALLAIMFNTGARVQEIANLRACDVQLIKPFQLRLFGKGRKERYCPLWRKRLRSLRSFWKHCNLDQDREAHVFLNHRDQPLSASASAHSRKRLGLAARRSESAQEDFHPTAFATAPPWRFSNLASTCQRSVTCSGMQARQRRVATPDSILK
jgi:site-specific recombinase XerD